MTTYYYTALDHKGESCEGDLIADNESEAIQLLRARGLYPTVISTLSDGGKRIETGARELPTVAFVPWFIGVFVGLILVGFFLVFLGRIIHVEQRPAPKPVNGQTLIIEGKKYKITITPIE